MITQRLKEGLTLRQIWQELRGDGRVSVAQSNFYVSANKVLNLETGRKAGRDLAPAAPPHMPVIASARRNCADPAASVVAGPTAQFVHSNRPDEDNW